MKTHNYQIHLKLASVASVVHAIARALDNRIGMLGKSSFYLALFYVNSEQL